MLEKLSRIHTRARLLRAVGGEEMSKEALLGKVVAKGGLGLGKTLLKGTGWISANPMKALTIGGLGMGGVSAGQAGARAGRTQLQSFRAAARKPGLQAWRARGSLY